MLTFLIRITLTETKKNIASKIVNVCTNTHKEQQFSVSEWGPVTPIICEHRRESIAPSERVFQELLRVEDAVNLAEKSKGGLKPDIDNTNKRSIFSCTPRSFGQAVDDFGDAPISHIEGNTFCLVVTTINK